VRVTVPGAPPRPMFRSSLLLALFVRLSVLQPFQELLCRFANLLTGRQVDVLLARLRTPTLENLFGHEVCLVVGQEDSRDLGNQLGMVFADEAFGSAEEGFLVLVGGDELGCVISRCIYIWTGRVGIPS
jgi:hypothetical protein